MPRARLLKGDVRSVRLPADLAAAIDRVRGEIKFSVWACEIMQDACMNPEERAVRKVEESMRHHGVTIDMLLSKQQK